MEKMKYFDFDMLNKHSMETLDYISSWFLLAFIVIIVYTIVKLFLKWDNT